LPGELNDDSYDLLHKLTPDTLQGTLTMIRSFKHKGLARFFRNGSTSGIQHNHAKKLRLILGRLNVAEDIEDMDLPGLRLHMLSGSRTNIWSVSVNGNWRVTFRFTNGDAEVVNYEDYH